MAVLAQETEIANQRGREATAAAQAQEEKAENFEHEVLNAQKKVILAKNVPLGYILGCKT